MKRIVIVATLIAFAQMASGFSPMPQTFPGGTTLRRIQVNAPAITALAPGKNYVVDLTQPGVIYEFSSQAGQIDFTRVRVRTAQGEVAIGSFMETAFPKDKLKGFKLASQAFILGTRAPGALQNPPAGTSNFTCKPTFCECIGKSDCIDLIFNTALCRGPITCNKDEITGQQFCLCDR